MAFTKVRLSGGVDGKNIKVVQTATAGTLLHTAHATNQDEVWLWAVNSSAVPVKLTIEFGGVATPDDLIELTIQPESGAQIVIPGWILTNSLVARAFAETANVIMINGYVNRIS